MNTTVDSLKALYVKFGGDPDNVAAISTIPDMIDALTEIVDVSGGGSGGSGQSITVNGERIVIV